MAAIGRVVPSNETKLIHSLTRLIASEDVAQEFEAGR
jgi:hypothetical protein